MIPNDLPDHPAVRNAEATGYPSGKEPRYPICPVCGCECETVYKGLHLEIIGCDVCVTTSDAWQEDECFLEYPEKEVW